MSRIKQLPSDSDVRSVGTSRAEDEGEETRSSAKATFYIVQDLLDELEEAWLTLRAKPNKLKVSKSHLVSAILGEGISELMSLPKDQLLARLSKYKNLGS